MQYVQGTYIPADKDDWNGRIDAEDSGSLRWHQQIHCIDLERAKLPPLKPGGRGIAILGFACDEGVLRNLGRPGAAKGPAMLRKACASLPVHFPDTLTLVDAGTICCKNGALELAQACLSVTVSDILGQGYLPMVWGGGHELMYGHFTGIRNFYRQSGSAAIGIINFDAHFDLRSQGPGGANSGTGFFQAAVDCRNEGVEFIYLALGIQQNSNTRSLFTRADELDVRYIEGKEFLAGNSRLIQESVQDILWRSEGIYLTLCMDVFAAAFAPGVSAQAKSGIFPDGLFWNTLKMILCSGKVRGVDIAELNPSLDPEMKTSGLAAALSFEIVESLK